MSRVYPQIPQIDADAAMGSHAAGPWPAGSTDNADQENEC
jgi:hypothetical protein